MSDVERIEPALTKEEWAAGVMQRGDSELSLERGVGDGSLYIYLLDAIPDDEGTATDASHQCTPDESFAIMALANAALPDGDPRKITRDLEWDLRRGAGAAEQLAGTFPVGNGMRASYSDLARRLNEHAAVIAALLPPEGT